MHGHMRLNNETVAQAVSTALRYRFGDFNCAVKRIARTINCDQRAARNWWEGNNSPRAAELIELMREFDEVHEEVLRLANRNSIGSSEPDIKKRIEQAMKILSGENNEDGNYRGP